MKNYRILAAVLCILLLAGCGLTPREEAEESPAGPTQTAPLEEAGEMEASAQEAGEAETPANEAGAVEQAEADPTPTPEPTPAGIVLSGGVFPEETEELTAVVTAEDLALLEGFPNLQKADLRGSLCRKEIAAWAIAHPAVRVSCEA